MENQNLFELIKSKGSLKQDIYTITYNAFSEFKKEAARLAEEYIISNEKENTNNVIPFTFSDKGDFEFEIIFGGDVLLFLMHSNVFELPRDHEAMKTHYIKEDKNRSYCGTISIYNFLADSFKYGREGDAGYMIGRLMVNKENHYMLEGKKELGMIYHSFEKTKLDTTNIKNIISSAIQYTVNFDLLIPPYEKVMFITVLDVLRASQSITMQTGKRLGYKFKADREETN